MTRGYSAEIDVYRPITWNNLANNYLRAYLDTDDFLRSLSGPCLYLLFRCEGATGVAAMPTGGDLHTQLHEDPMHNVQWQGLYVPLVREEDGSFMALLGENGEPQYFPCAHCAYKYAASIVPVPAPAAHGRAWDAGARPMVLLVKDRDVSLRGYMPPAPELAGGTYTQITNKLSPDWTPGTLCGNCGLLNHTARSCTRGPKAYLKVGIEIEGRWLNLAQVQTRALDAGMDYSADGSIRASRNNRECRPHEFKTKPGSLKDALSQLALFYPDEADESCGMHVHVSFSPHDVGLLATKEFFAYFRSRWEAFGLRHGLHPQSPFFERLKGNNDYCLPNGDHVPEDVTQTDKYTQLNFYPWHRFKTVECRLLPMFTNAWLAVEAITELLTIYQDYFDAHEDIFGMPQDLVGQEIVEPFSTEITDSALDLDLLVALQNSVLEHELEVAEIPPVPEGMRRVGLPRTVIDELNRHCGHIFAEAA